MANGPNETPRQKLAQAARQEDMKSANDGARTAAQTSVLINGGAATAVLAFLSTYLSKGATPPPSLPVAVPLSLLGYALGVCFGAWSMWSASQACGQFGLRWETFLDAERDKAQRDQAEKAYLDEGNRRLESHRNSFALSIALFLISSAGMAYGILAGMK